MHELERGQFNQINIITTIFTITMNDWLLYVTNNIMPISNEKHMDGIKW